MKKVAVLVGLLVCAVCGALDVSLAHRNDALGFGFDTEWDDFETYAFDARIARNPWAFDIHLASLTSRKSSLRVDRLEIGLGYCWEPGRGLVLVPRLGMSYLGNLGGMAVQEEWHRDVAGVSRPVPHSYESVDHALFSHLGVSLGWWPSLVPWEFGVLSETFIEIPSLYTQDLTVELVVVPGFRLLGGEFRLPVDLRRT
jgi:hypothetical protein